MQNVSSSSNIDLSKWVEGPEDSIEKVDTWLDSSEKVDAWLNPSSNLSRIVSTPKLFRNTDLIVFKDSFAVSTRPLPLNGISESELKRITDLYVAIVDGKKKIRIEDYDSDDEKVMQSYGVEKNHLNLTPQDIKASIKTLLTRSAGRRIFYAMEDSKDRTIIKNGKVNRCRKGHNKKTNLPEFKIYLYQEPCKFYSYNSKGQRITTPFFLPNATAHELIHTFDDKDLGFIPKSMQKSHGDYTNKNERKTISGYRTEKSELKGRNFNPICENSVRVAFNQLPRINHLMFYYIPNPNNPLEPDLSSAKLRSDYLKRLIWCDVAGDIEKFLDECRDHYDDAGVLDRCVPFEKGENDEQGKPLPKNLTPLQYAKLRGSEEVQEVIQSIHLGRLIKHNKVEDIEKFLDECRDDYTLLDRRVPVEGEVDQDGNPVTRSLTPLKYAKLNGTEKMQKVIQKATDQFHSNYLGVLIACNLNKDLEKLFKKYSNDLGLLDRYIPIDDGEVDRDGNPLSSNLTPLAYAKLRGNKKTQKVIQKVLDQRVVQRTPKPSSKKKGKEVVRD